MLQASLLFMMSLNKTKTPIFLSAVCFLFPKAIFFTFISIFAFSLVIDYAFMCFVLLH